MWLETARRLGRGGPDARKFARVAGGALGLVLVVLFLLDYSCFRNELTVLSEESSLRQEVDKIMMYDTPLNEAERLFKARGYEVEPNRGWPRTVVVELFSQPDGDIFAYNISWKSSVRP